MILRNLLRFLQLSLVYRQTLVVGRCAFAYTWLASRSFERRHDPGAWTQRNCRIRFHRVIAAQAQAVSLSHRGEHQLRFHQGEVVADAYPRAAAAEREVSVARAGRRLLVRKAFGDELIRTIPDPGLATMWFLLDELNAEPLQLKPTCSTRWLVQTTTLM